MTIAELAYILNSCLGIAGLATWWFWLHAAYARDSFRQAVFALRDEMFDYAASGAISFEHPAYANLRLLLNRVIRFAHRITIWQMLGFAIVESVTEEDHQRAAEFSAEWRTAVNSIADAEVRQKFFEFEHRLASMITRRLVSTSLLALLFGGVTLSLRRALQLTSSTGSIRKFFSPAVIEERAWQRAA